jgi:hypothetical protein
MLNQRTKGAFLLSGGHEGVIFFLVDEEQLFVLLVCGSYASGP